MATDDVRNSADLEAGGDPDGAEPEEEEPVHVGCVGEEDEGRGWPHDPDHKQGDVCGQAPVGVPAQVHGRQQVEQIAWCPHGKVQFTYNRKGIG